MNNHPEQLREYRGMFGIRIFKSSTLSILVAGTHADVLRGHTELCGPVGLYLARRRYRHMLATWREQANSWWCGEQDHYGDLLDDAKQQVIELGGNPTVDRHMVMADKY